MHHLVIGVVFYAFMALAVAVFGPAAVVPMADLVPRARHQTLIFCWLTLFLSASLLLALLNSYLDDYQHTYLCEIGQVWPGAAMLFGGLTVSFVRRWRGQAR